MGVRARERPDAWHVAHHNSGGTRAVRPCNFTWSSMRAETSGFSGTIITPTSSPLGQAQDLPLPRFIETILVEHLLDALGIPPATLDAGLRAAHHPPHVGVKAAQQVIMCDAHINRA